MVGLLLAAAFIGMVAVIIPSILLMVVAGFGLMLLFVAQYFLWAKWMFPVVQRLEREKDETERLRKASTSGDYQHGAGDSVP